jgi:hypothetical protein
MQAGSETESEVGVRSVWAWFMKWIPLTIRLIFGPEERGNSFERHLQEATDRKVCFRF